MDGLRRTDVIHLLKNVGAFMAGGAAGLVALVLFFLFLVLMNGGLK